MKREVSLAISNVVVLASLAGPVVQAQGTPSSVSPEKVDDTTWANVPTQAQIDDIWSKLVGLIAKHGGYVSKEEFEETFGVRLRSAEPSRTSGSFYSAHQGVNWVLTIGLTDQIRVKEGGGGSNLSIDFEDERPWKQRKSDYPCLSKETVVDDLVKSGWRSEGEELGQWNRFSRASFHGSYVARLMFVPSGKRVTSVQYSSACVQNIDVGLREYVYGN